MAPPVAEERARRVFFALWPDASLQAVLADLAREMARDHGGRPTASNQIHLTLAFLGEQPEARVATLCRLAGDLRARVFTLTLDVLGGFARGGIAWLGASEPQPGLAALHRELAAALRQEGFAVDERPYTAHLTLARRSRAPLERRLAQPLGWPVTSFFLVASELGRGGSTYRKLAEWPLSAP
jgi:2'-5' RNA ligase